MRDILDMSELFLSLLLWLGLNFRRVSAEYFIGFRRVPGQFLSPPSFSTPALLLMLMLLLLLDALLCSSLSHPLAGSEFPQSIRRVFYWFPQSAGSIFEPSLVFNASATFSRDVCSNTQIMNASASFGGWCESAFFKGCP